jgi:hypothetical protein
VIGDPALLLTFYELKRPPGSRNSHHSYSTEFRSLVYEGDRKLLNYSHSILFELFGPFNYELYRFVHIHWVSNETIRELSILYRLNEYVGWSPRPLRTVGTIDAENFWVTIWKVWWASCFREREVWGDDIEDLLSCLRRIIITKYRGLVQQYTTNTPVIQGSSSNETSVVAIKHANEGIVLRGDDVICKWIGQDRKRKATVLGYLSPIGIDIPVYAVEKDEAASAAFAYAKCGFKGNHL